jgi:hypothetical protein
MKKFLVLYMAPYAVMQEMMKTMSEADGQAEMDAWMKWSDAHKTSIVDMGAPLGKTKKVAASGASDTHNDLGGYSIVQANSADDAAKLFGKDHPHFKMRGATVEVVEIMAMPGM